MIVYGFCMQGGVYWVGGGMCIVIGTPIIDVSGIYASELMGEFTGLASECLCQHI